MIMTGLANGTEFLVIREANLYSPEPRGIVDIVCFGNTVVDIASSAKAKRPTTKYREIDAHGRIVTPGFVDQHIHLSGGGGGGGPATRNPPLKPSQLAAAGITTAVACQGYEPGNMGLPFLLGHCRGLASRGFATFFYSGGIPYPPSTITGEIADDLAIIPDCLGVKVAIADASSRLVGGDQLQDVAAQVAVGARAGSKRGVVHIHVGLGHEGMKPLMGVVESGAIPGERFVVTHINWSQQTLSDAIVLARLGATVDVTCAIQPRFFEGVMDPGAALIALLSEESIRPRVTISSDSNGSTPIVSADGRVEGVIDHPPTILLDVFRKLANAEGHDFTLEHVLPSFTSNPARSLGLWPRHGTVSLGSRADLLVLDDDHSLSGVVIGGNVAVHQGRPDKFDFFN